MLTQGRGPGGQPSPNQTSLGLYQPTRTPLPQEKYLLLLSEPRLLFLMQTSISGTNSLPTYLIPLLTSHNGPGRPQPAPFQPPGGSQERRGPAPVLKGSDRRYTEERYQGRSLL